MVGGGDSFELAGGLLNLTAEIAAATTLTARVVVRNSGNTPVVTLAHTLNIGACSFLTGCQPLVAHDGAAHGRYYDGLLAPGLSSDRDSWLAIDVPLAQALIAAGADVNERINGDEPLLAVARFGSPAVAAVASVLLTAGADANAKSDLLFELSGTTTRNAGIFHYLFLTPSTNNLAAGNQLASLFISAGADVNYLNSIDRTPLDSFAFSSLLNDDILIAAGGKCFVNCNLGDFIRLTAVSFSPAALTVTVGDTDTGDIYTVQAASGLGTQFSYAVDSVSPTSSAANFNLVSVDVNSAKLNVGTALGSSRPSALTVFIEVTDNNSTSDKATLRVNIAE